MAHLEVVSDFRYLQNLASSFENTVMCRPKAMFLLHHLLSFKDIKKWRPPQDVPCNAAQFTYQVVNSLIKIAGLNWAVCIKNRLFLMS